MDRLPMPFDDLHLQLLPGPQIALTNRGAQGTSVPAQPFPLPRRAPTNREGLWAALPESIRQALAALDGRPPDAPLPLWLDLQLPEARDWPWERLAPGTPNALPFSLRPATPLVRFLPAGPAPATRPGIPRLLAIAAAPQDLDPIDTAPIQQLVQRLHDPQRLITAWHAPCSPRDLPNLLRRHQPDILLILAHGEPGMLLLEDADHVSVELSAKELATLLHGTPVRAVLLASCNGAVTTADAQSTAETLLAAGVLGVTAMNDVISLPAVEAFLDGVLTSIRDGWPLERATVDGRRQIIARLGDHGPWDVPVCWQRALHRPLVLPPHEVLRRGAARLTAPAPSRTTQLVAGSWLGLLLMAGLQSLFLPTGIPVPALVTLLEGLGLNVFAGYLGNALGDIWRRAGRSDATEATEEEIGEALQTIADTQQDAAVQLDHLARSSGALQITLEAINQGVAGSQAVLAALEHDIARHGAVLADLHADMRTGLGALYQQGRATQDAVRDVHAEVRAIREELTAPERARREQVAAQRHAYLQTLIRRYEQVTLSRFMDRKRGSGETVIEEPSLQAIYVALTTGSERSLPLRRAQRPAWVVQRALRFFARLNAADVPPQQVRRFMFAVPDMHAARQRPARRPRSSKLNDAPLPPAVDAEHWMRADLPDNLDPNTSLPVQLTRPELAVETFAPAAGAAPRVVLLGEPGSGKSTVLRYTAVLLAKVLLGERPLDLTGWDAPRLPLLLPLGTLGERLNAPTPDVEVLRQALADLLAGEAAQARPDLGAALPQLWAESILLLDGLDELSAEPPPNGGASPRRRVACAIERLAEELPQTPIIVTCRVRPYRTLVTPAWQLPEPVWRVAEVQPFAFGQVRQFVHGWYAAGQPVPELAARRAADLIGEMQQNPALREAITPAGTPRSDDPPASPLLLTMLTILHDNSDGRRLPSERDELYERLVELLLHRWEPRRSSPAYERPDLLNRLNLVELRDSTEPLRRVLHQIAFEAHDAARRGADGRGVLDADLVRGRFEMYFRRNLRCDAAEAAQKVDLFLEVLHDEAGLLTHIGDDAYALPHLTFQEYLAGCHLAARPNPVREAYALWNGPDGDRWREPLLLMCGRWRQQEGMVAREGLLWIKRLASDHYHPDPNTKDLTPKTPPQRQRDALFAYDCYEVLGYRTRLDDEEWHEAEQRIHTALQTIVPPTGLTPADIHLPPKERARAALLLTDTRLGDQAGDPRPGICTFPPAWCAPIPAGEYEIGTLSGATSIRLALESFQIARYPVTVGQYRQFVNAGGYDEPQWWTKHGKPLRKNLWPPARWHNPDFTAPNQPVVGVSWYEAVAFCNWLTKHGQQAGWLQHDQIIRLPTEAEWEVAAAWDATKGRMHAWNPPDGEIWQNVQEAGIGRPSPVGLFPQGASPNGALDMAGNVWEWCASPWTPWNGFPGTAAQQPKDYPPDQIGPSLRGGAYYLQNTSSGWGARFWFARGGDSPLTRYYYGGFRVVVCSVAPLQGF